MRTTIDKAGRLMIPRSLRTQIGLTDGGEVVIEVDGASIRVASVTGETLVEEDGRLVIPSVGVDLDDEAVWELRNEDLR